ncbi:MAG TPA: hypothetical protein DCZ63_08475 [Geobacter sp.]|nr:hypothetical protein [Geobacter sp.]
MKFRTMQSVLNAGELAPKLRGRSDIPRYQHGLEKGRNAICMVTGGTFRRGGTRKVAIGSGDNVRLIPFVLSLAGVQVGYMLEFGNLLVRFCVNNVQVMNGANPVQVATPYTAAQLAELSYEQYDNMLFLYHGSHQPRRLTRTNDQAWTLEEVPFAAYPYMRPPNTAGIEITPSATTGDITLTASAAYFVAAHVGLTLQVNGGLVEITAVTDATHAAGTVTRGIVPVDGINTIANAITVTYTPADPPGTDPVTFGIATLANFTASTMTVTPDDPLPAGMEVTVATTVNKLTGTEPDAAWKEIAWSDYRGWPRTGTFHEQRMVLAGSATYPVTVWGSKTAEIYDFTGGTTDNDAYTFTPAVATTPITQIVATDDMLVPMTFNRIITISGGTDKSITPTTPKIKRRTNHGCAAGVRPVEIAGEIFFTPPSCRKLRAWSYRADVDRFVAPDLAVLADHLLLGGDGVKEMAYAEEPEPVLWTVTRGGHLLTLTYDSDQDVKGFSRQSTDDAATVYLSVAKMPDAQGVDQVWQAAKRKIAGAWQTFIEYYDFTLAADDTILRQTDCHTVGTDAAGKTEWTVDYPDGTIVDIVADGYVSPPQVVAGGKVTLCYPAHAVEIGLHYRTTIKDLPPELANERQTIQGAATNVAKIRVRLLNSKGAKVNEEQIPFRTFGPDVLTLPVEQFTGDKEVQNLKRGNDPEAGQVTIIQDEPLPLTVLAIIKEISING